MRTLLAHRRRDSHPVEGCLTAQSLHQKAAIMKAEILPASEAMERALALLRAGDVVAIPTETVYGLAGDATNGLAVAKIFEAKGRPRFNPLIAHVASLEMARSEEHTSELQSRENLVCC